MRNRCLFNVISENEEKSNEGFRKLYTVKMDNAGRELNTIIIVVVLWE